MNTGQKIVIVDSSMIIRDGLNSILKRLPGFQLSVVEIPDTDTLLESIIIHKPDILIANPQLLIQHSLQNFREKCDNSDLKVVALLSNLYPSELLQNFDEKISIYDDIDTIKNKLKKLFSTENEESTETTEEQQSLSAREKEIVVCVVKGMTNREIADTLFLSAHTVITHRRNIARKLQIHSTSGLTIYAIMNKLVDLKDI